ncbi:MAG: CCA tRNA nucleotidyltransferase [Patescibacteria group bacterium]|nr:CCA tRNA nucleotidyltransferase [Patescibacteria group bacterium]MDD3777913.1 CCA tRNA nucleotidyltransferase [Patescibacteria group bacterium]MDD3939520.1 CCA tRNA nucleotidyltransferase [Patescibacteria group bacterium]MDD4443745.1 CCA tRNA nucleotidyltransferase [Patescibacteria group bacterium]
MEIPNFVLNTTDKIKAAGFESFIVGGPVRDFLMNKEPKDWDITTNAKPEEIVSLFKDAKYNNSFGTVLLPVRDSAEKIITVLEITTYRSEATYSDRRHPDRIEFEKELDKDLSRRDFTINALAIDPAKAEKVIDLFGGLKDIKLKIIRAIGEPSDRFKEDALRMLRAVRFATQLDFTLEPKTERALTKLAGSLKFVSNERIRDELIKILASDRPAQGIELLQKTKLLQYIIPELEQGINVKQDRHHIYPVFKHNLLALKYCPNKDWQVRLAALLHDVAKPKTRKIIKNIATFYNHEYLGAKMVNRIMTRLKFTNEDRERVVNLVKNHMFYYNVGEVSAASVRRLIAKVGQENLADLIDLRVADRLGSGTPKAMPYKLRHLQYMMEKVQHDPVSVKMLKVNGDSLMLALNTAPGPKIGAILDVLLSEVIEEPSLNEEAYLLKRAKKLNELKLDDLRQQAKNVIAEKRQEEDKDIKKQFKV